MNSIVGQGPRPAVLTRTSAGARWAWFGVQVDAATDLTKAREYSDLEQLTRVRKAHDRQKGWLNRLWSIQPSGAVEFRWRSDGNGSLSLAILARVGASLSEDLSYSVESGLATLTSAPDHVLIEPIEDPERLRAELTPFELRPLAVAELRHRSRTAVPSRPDAEVSYYFAFQPFGGVPESWSVLLQALAASPSPCFLSVGLRPTRVSEDDINLLYNIASSYRRLAERAQPTGVGLYKKLRELGPDAFAVDAQHLYQDAARRLQGYGFELRISLGASRHLEAGLVAAAVDVIGGGERRDSDQGDRVSQEFRGSAAEVVVPTSEADFRALVHNVTSIGFEDWGGHPVWQSAAPPNPRLRILARMADADEAAAAAHLPIAAAGVLPGFPVRAPSFAVEATYQPKGDWVVLGTQMVAGREAGQLRVGLDSLRTHAFFAGTTGAGKSTAVLSLLAQLWLDHRIPFLVFEPVNTVRNDYRQFLTTPGFEETLVLTAGSDDLCPIRLNPFQVPPKVLVGQHVANVLGAFDAAFGLFDPLPALYREALTAVYAEAGIPLNVTGDQEREWPTLRDFEAELSAVVAKQNYEGEVRSNIEAASLVRIRQLANGPAASVFDCRRSTPLTSLLERPAIIELGHLGTLNEGEQNLVIGMVMVTLAEQLVSMDRIDGLNHVIVLEEAHRFLKKPEPAREGKGDPSAGAAKLFGNLLAEVRKHGEAIIVVDQDPEKLIPDTYKNTNLKMMFRLQSEDDRERVGSAMAFDEDHLKAAGILDTFMGFAHVAGMDRPAHIQSTAREMVEKEWLRHIATDGEIAERFAAQLATDDELADAIRPFRACSGCESVCRYRSASAMAASRSVARSQFSALVDEMPSVESPDRRLWLAKVSDGLGHLLRDVGLEDGADQRGCLFVHAARLEWKANVDTTKVSLEHWGHLREKLSESAEEAK